MIVQHTMTYTDEEVKIVIELYLTIYIIAYICTYTRLVNYSSTESIQPEVFSDGQEVDPIVYIWPELD